MRLFQAFGVFFRVLTDGKFAEQLNSLGESESPKELPKPDDKEKKQKTPPKPSRNDALTMLAALQREARFIDIIKEPLADYSNEQVGAAARDVLSDCSKVIDRLFGIEPVLEGEEGSTVQTPDKVDPGVYQLTGNVSGDAPFSGSLIHHGWQATKCELPKWNGSDVSSQIIAPAEVEIS